MDTEAISMFDLMREFSVGIADRNVRCWCWWHIILKGEKVYWRRHPMNGRKAEGYCKSHAEAVIYTAKYQGRLF